MGIDRPDDDDVPSDAHSDRGADRDSATDRGKTPAETRSHEEAYLDLRGAAAIEERTEPAGRAEPGARSKPAEPTENRQQAKAAGNWEETAQLGRWMWEEYKRRWPPEERPTIDSSGEPGTWRGDGVRCLDQSENEIIEAEYDHIGEREKEKLSPALREIENCDSNRHLAGFEHRLKERDRIKEKAYDNMQEFRISPAEAVSLVSDAIRYTFQYEESDYTRGVRADVARLEEQGFVLDKLKNYWSDNQYKGINSQWIEPETGQRFEVQFHTHISFETKELTHGCYERLRTGEPGKPDKFEQMVLEAFQMKFTAEVPIPLGAADIPDYPKRGTCAR